MASLPQLLNVQDRGPVMCWGSRRIVTKSQPSLKAQAFPDLFCPFSAIWLRADSGSLVAEGAGLTKIPFNGKTVEGTLNLGCSNSKEDKCVLQGVTVGADLTFPSADCLFVRSLFEASIYGVCLALYMVYITNLDE